ncbi:MAG: hypothetical protein M1823_006570, partial [Watsoniomyces obsoletus]
MLAFEHAQRETFFQEPYFSAGNVQAPYPGLDMDSFTFGDSVANFHPLPFSYFDNPGMFVPAPAQSLKPQMTRSISSNSNAQHRPHHSSDMAPGLVSSASSSTVGSPYSGPMHSDSLRNSVDTYDGDILPHGLGLMPTIVNQDSFNHEFVGAGFDIDLPVGHDKITGNFVVESAELSSLQKRSSAFPYPNSRHAQSASPAAPLSSSPEVLTGNAPINKPRYVPAVTYPTPSVSVPRSTALPVSASHQQIAEPLFKSPTTPASAYPKTPSAHSPIERMWPTQGAQPAAPAKQQAVVLHQPQPMSQHGGQFQHHFFAQSSGNFMPPLETS